MTKDKCEVRALGRPLCLRMDKSDLLRSHDDLRAVLRLAGMEIRKLNFGRKDSPLLQLMRRVLQRRLPGRNLQPRAAGRKTSD